MPTPAPDLSRLNMTQLVTLTGRDRRWITERFVEANLAPLEATRREKWYPARPALEAIYHATDGLDLTAERARLAKEQADAQELKNAELRGELIRGDDVDLFLLGLFGAFTQRVRAIPPKAAPEVRATKTDAEAEAQLTAFHDEALTELAEAARGAADRVARRSAGETAKVIRGVRGRAPAAAAADGERVGGRGEKAIARVERGAGAVEDGEG